MGSEININKHTTSIDDWIDLESKMEGIDFDQHVCPHLSAWKFFNDELNPQEFNCLPIQLELQSLHQHLSPHHTYLLLAINNPEITVQTCTSPVITSLAHFIKQNIDKRSYSTYISHKTIEQSSYYVYAWFGKMSKHKLRLVALSYAVKLQKLLGSKKNMAVLSGGGMLRNKKLQKGSVLPLINKTSAGNKQVNEQTQIHVFSVFKPSSSKTNPLITFQPKIKNPFIQQVSKVNTEKPQNIKPPLLKLTLKPYQEVNYSQIQEQQRNGLIQFDIRTTARHELKMQKFQGQCSEIIEGVFVSGQKVAKSYEILERYKIKSIINCAGDYCENWFQNKGINYLTFFLKDSQNQNIECLFYRSIDYILNCHKNKNNVLIHCIQGISRSITIATAFIIFKMGYDYKKAEQLVKQKRAIACPNNGFMVELIQFHKRLYQSYDSLPNPRAFLVSSHCKETPNFITARLLKCKLFDPKKYIGLDARAVYIIQAPDIVYIWVGSKCQEKKLQNYWSYAQEYVKKLQKYERASLKIKAISQGTEGKQFFSLWNLDQQPEIYENPQYTRLFADGQSSKPGGMRKYYEKQIQQEATTRLFIYPDDQEGLGVFQWQDVSGLCVLGVIQGQSLRMIVIKGSQCDGEVGQFLQSIIKNHYPSYDSNQITIEQQNMKSPSAAVLAYFS